MEFISLGSYGFGNEKSALLQGNYLLLETPFQVFLNVFVCQVVNLC